MNEAVKEQTKVADLSANRTDFPIFDTEMNGKPLAYLDTASSAQKPNMVLQAMRDVYENHYANIHRGLYHHSQVTTQLFEAARQKVAAFLGAGNAEEIIFTRNATESINLVAHSWGRSRLRAGDEIIISEMEHHANIVPWQLLAREIGVVLRVAPVDVKTGELDFGAFVGLLSERTKLVALTHMSNVLGTVNPVKKITKAVKDFSRDIHVLIDGAQGVVHQSVDVVDIGCDFYCFTGHKLYGPNGIGVLWGREDVLYDMPPYQGGGDMIETVAFKGDKGEPDGTLFKMPPARFEAGTPPIVEAIGLASAIDYLNILGADNIYQHEEGLLQYLTRKLQAFDGVRIYGTAQGKAGVVSFTVDWAHASDVSMILDKCGVAVRSGHHCCMPLMARLGVDATMRASLGVYSNRGDIDQMITALHKAREMLA